MVTGKVEGGGKLWGRLEGGGCLKESLKLEEENQVGLVIKIGVEIQQIKPYCKIPSFIDVVFCL